MHGAVQQNIIRFQRYVHERIALCLAYTMSQANRIMHSFLTARKTISISWGAMQLRTALRNRQRIGFIVLFHWNRRSCFLC